MEVIINKHKFLLLHYRDLGYRKRAFCQKCHISLRMYDKIMNEQPVPLMTAILVAEAFDEEYKTILN